MAEPFTERRLGAPEGFGDRSDTWRAVLARPLRSLTRRVCGLWTNYARYKILSVIDGIPEQTLARGGTSREALRRDVIAYFRKLQSESDRPRCRR